MNSPIDPADFSCAAIDTTDTCQECRRGGACLRCSPEAMAKRSERDAWARTPSRERTAFDRLCHERQAKCGARWCGNIQDILKRIWSNFEATGPTYERAQTFRETKRYEDRIESLRGTKPRNDEELGKSLGCTMGHPIYDLLYANQPFFGLRPKDGLIWKDVKL